MPPPNRPNLPAPPPALRLLAGLAAACATLVSAAAIDMLARPGAPAEPAPRLAAGADAAPCSAGDVSPRRPC